LSRFEKAVAEAVAAERPLREHEAFICTGLTKQAYVREAEAQAGLGDDAEAKLEKLAEALQKPGHDRANRALANMLRAITGKGTFKFSRPSKKIGHLIDQEGLAELASCGASALELFALAAREADPSVFGEVEDMVAAEQELARLKGELESAIETVEASWGADDIEVGQDGRCVFRGLGVTLTSVDLGRRLLDAALAEEAKRAA